MEVRILPPLDQNGGRSFSGFTPHAPRLKHICCGVVPIWLRAHEEFTENRFQLLSTYIEAGLASAFPQIVKTLTFPHL